METAVVDARAVSFQDVSTVAGSTSTISGTTSATAADVTITTLPASGTARVLKKDNQLFVSGDQGAVAALLNLTAAQLATVGTKWISVTKTDAPFAAIAKSLTPVGLVHPFLSSAPTSTDLLATATSPAATVISGPWHGDGATNGWTGLTSLRIDPATSLPRSGLIELHHQSSIATRAVVFSSWTAAIAITVPTVSIAYESIAA